jgi:acetoin utilization deacetylase AcuC-like enzyme
VQSRRRGAAAWNRRRDGELVPGHERHDRVEAIQRGLTRAGARVSEVFVEPAQVRAALHAIHDPVYLEFLERTSATLGRGEQRFYEEWSPPGLAVDTPLFRGAFSVAEEGVRTALGAAALVANGTGTAYAICRPPGHHAGPSWLGGYCYLNNAAAAAWLLREAGARVVILDLDFHLGHGTAAIAGDMPGVRYVSFHASESSYYPWIASEPPSQSTWISYPQAPSEDELVDDVEAAVVEHAADSDAVVVSVGFDIVRDDPHGGWDCEPAVFESIGRVLASRELPLCLVQEGGYAIELLEECAFRLGRGLVSDPLQPLRDRLDVVDEQILTALAERFDLCRSIGRVKRDERIPIMQEHRLAAVRAHYASAVERGVPRDFVDAFFDLVTFAACCVEEEVLAPAAVEEGP